MSRAPSTDLSAYGRILMPDEAQEPILARPVRTALTEWLTEIWCGEELRAVDLMPRRRAIFTGPPGGGKTTLAHHLSARLGLPMLVVTPDRFKTAFVSESAAQVGNLFRALQAVPEPMLVFFDEFDSLAAKRMNTGHNPGVEQNHNEVINSMLQGLDACNCFVVAATNFADRVDEAIWRRFEIQITLDLPGDSERRRILARYFAPFVLPETALAALSEALATASPALIRQFAEHIKRQIVVGPKADWPMDRDAVIARVVTSVKPHPDLGLPRLWSLGVKDKALAQVPWPLMRALADYPDHAPAAAKPGGPAKGGDVVPMRRKGGEK
jgi:MoxR-like ATPase